MTKKKILAICGSPHHDGHCATILHELLQQIPKANYHIDYIHLYDKQLSYCNGCRICDQSDICIIQDDIQDIAYLLKHCDIVLFACPTYWGNVPGIVKNLFDRLVGSAMKKTKTFPKPKLSKKQRYVLITSCDTAYPFSWIYRQSSGCIHAMNEFFKTSGMTYGGTLIWTNTKASLELPPRLKKKIRTHWLCQKNGLR